MDKAIYYDHVFYSQQSRGSYESAKIIIPLVMSLGEFKSVVDFGCGIGTWLRAFSDNGVSDLAGYEGDWVKGLSQLVPAGVIQTMDLNQAIATDRPYDLAVSLEVAEHLHPTSAEQFISALCRSASVVLFSAAIPGQGGTNHINERWQDYWAELFRQQGFIAHDLIRPLVSGNSSVMKHYRQNTILYVSSSSRLITKLAPFAGWTLNYVDPESWDQRCRSPIEQLLFGLKRDVKAKLRMLGTGYRPKRTKEL